MARFMCIGDLHCNERGGLGPERLKDQEQVWRQALQLALEEHCDATLFLGDAWEHRRPTPAEYIAFRRPLKGYVDIGGGEVIAILGNHDLSHPDEPTGLDVCGDLLELHRRPNTTTVAGVTLVTLPWAPVSRLVAEAGAGTDRDDLNAVAAEHLVNVARGFRQHITGPAVLLAHWAVTGASTPDGIPTDLFREPVLDVHALLDQGWDAIVAGHIHKRQHLGFRPDAPFFYVGSPLPLNHGEASCEHGVWILEGPPFTAEFRPLASRRFLTFDLPPVCVEALTRDGSVLFAGDPEDGFTEDDDVTDAVVRVRYEASEEQARRIDNVRLRQSVLDAGAWRATVEPTITRPQRARAAGMTAELSDADAFRLWLTTNGIEKRQWQALIEAHHGYGRSL